MNVKGAVNEPNADLAAPLAFTFTNDAALLHGVRDRVRAHLRSFGVDEAAIHAVDLTLEELAGNVIRHGYSRDRVGEIRVGVSLTPSVVRVTITDDARAFDPTAHPEPAPFRSVGDAPVGGRGISMVRKIASAMRYRFEGGRNQVEVEIAREGHA